jgi:hypothetical protein
MRNVRIEEATIAELRAAEVFMRSSLPGRW